MYTKNKQSLILLKKQIKTVRKSRKMLDEKLSGLVQAFHDAVIEGYMLEEKVRKNTQSIIGDFVRASTFVNSQKLIQFSHASLKDTATAHYELSSSINKFFGVPLPTIELSMRQLMLPNHMKPVLHTSLTQFNSKMPLFLQLLQAQLKCQLLAKEIAKTNRLIANIDKRIETMTHGIKSISSYLLEKENETKAILIKIKSTS